MVLHVDSVYCQPPLNMTVVFLSSLCKMNFMLGEVSIRKKRVRLQDPPEPVIYVLHISNIEGCKTTYT